MVKEKGFAHILLFIILLIGLGVGVYLVQQKTNFLPKAFEGDKSVEELTNQLLELNSTESGRSAESYDSQKVAQMFELAKKRQVKLLEMLQVNPELFLNQATLRYSSRAFPDDIKPFLESRISVEGQLTVTHADNFDQKTTKTTYALKTADKTYQLNLADPSVSLDSDLRVEVNGVLLGDQIALSQPGQIVPTGRQSLDFTPPKELKLAVILLNFSGEEKEPFSKTETMDAVINSDSSVKRYFEEVSFNQIAVSGEVFGWYTVDKSKGTFCNFREWGILAAAKAKTAGVDLTKFSHRVFIFPAADSSNCWFAGVADIGGTDTWINGNISAGVMAHELGHNIGLHHANDLNCRDKSIDHYANCQEYEYGDFYDVMGWAQLHHLNAPHKAALGWLPESRIAEVRTDGIYKIAPIESVTTSPQALKIGRININDDYYVEYRQPIGLDSSLPQTVTQGALIHIAHENRNGFTQILNPFPNEFDYDKTHTLRDGGGFIDSINGVAIQQISHTKDEVTLSVKLVPVTEPTGSWLGYFKKQFNLPGRFYVDQVLESNNFLLSWSGNFFAEGAPIYIAKVKTGGNLLDWEVGGRAPMGQVDYATAASSDSVYLAGGTEILSGTFSTYQDRVVRARVENGGEIGPWTEVGVLPFKLVAAKAIVLSNHLLIFGGYKDTGVFNDQVLAARIGSDGSLGSWRTVSTLPAGLSFANFSVSGDGETLVLSRSGFDFVNPQTPPKPETKIYYTKLNLENQSNAVSAWNNLAGPFQSLFNPLVIYKSGQLLVAGGSDDQFRNQYQIYLNNLDVSMSGGWKTLKESPLPRPLTKMVGVISQNSLIIGGEDSQSRAGTTFFSAPILETLIPDPTTPTTIPTPIQIREVSINIWDDSTVAFEPQNPTKNDDVTINFNKSSGVTHVNLLIDGAETNSNGGALNQVKVPLDQAGAYKIIWPKALSHTPGKHLIGVKPYYCNPDSPSQCSPGGPDTIEITLSP